MDVYEGASHGEPGPSSSNRENNTAPGDSCSGGRRGSGGSDGRGRPLSWQKPGFVPDHVRNPGRYTMYSFDEPVIVGFDKGGGRRAGVAADDITYRHEVRTMCGQEFEACAILPPKPALHPSTLTL